MRSKLTTVLHKVTSPFIALPGAALIAAFAVYIAFQTVAVVPTGDYVAATRASIAAVGGQNFDLSFQAPGQIAEIPVTIGEQVPQGATIAILDRSALMASRAGAVANLEAAQARLAALTAGTRPEQIAVDETAVAQAKAALLDATRSAYINADDAVHNKADQFFTNPRNALATLTMTVSDYALKNTIQSERIALEPTLSTWSADVNASSFASSDPLAKAAQAQAALAQVSTFLDSVAVMLANASSSSLPVATLQGYQAAINAARLSVSGSASAITGATTALQGAQGALTLAQAGPTAHDVAAAQATVDAAQAAVQGIDVALHQSVVTTPIAGTVTALNVHVGQTVAPGQVIASIETIGGSKAEALVIPKSSVIVDNGQAFVYLKGATATPVKTIVTTGLVGSDGMTEITGGLSEGQEVLTFGTKTAD